MSYTLFHLSNGPYTSVSAREGLDALLAYAAFGQPVRALFVGDGVYQLTAEHRPIGMVNLEKIIQAFEIYDIPTPGVCARALAERNLSAADLALQVQPLDNTDLTDWRAGANHILSF